MDTRLQELLAKMHKPPCQLTNEEALELQQLLTTQVKEARSERSSVGQRVSRQERGKAKKSREERLAELKDL